MKWIPPVLVLIGILGCSPTSDDPFIDAGTDTGVTDTVSESVEDTYVDTTPDVSFICTPGQWECFGDIWFLCAADGVTRTEETTCPDSCDPVEGCIDEVSSGCGSMDILFIVDISASMHEEQDNLYVNFPTFVEVLDTYVAADDTMADYRIGVTNMSINMTDGGCETTMGFNGALHAQEDCSVLETAPWIDGPAAGVTTSFTCLADNPIPPTGGTDCGHEMPLGVIEQFVAKLAPGEANEGFYRRDDTNSLLVIVILTDEDEDEFSTATPASAKAALDAIAGGEDRYVIVTIAGPEECDSTFGSAIDAVILQEFTSMVPNGVFGNICLGNLAEPLADALSVMTVACDELPELI